MNIFLIIFDTLRKDHTGRIYRNEWIKTPNFDNFARDSLVFDKAYPESLPTIPVRRAIHTGLRTFPFLHDKPKLRSEDFVEEPGWDPIPPNQTHLAEYMNRNAYTTLFITSTYHQFKPNMNFHLGFDEWHYIRGQEHDKYKARMRGSHKEINKIVRNYTIQKTKKNKGAVHLQKLLLKNYLANVQDRSDETDYFPAQTFMKSLDSIRDIKNSGNIFCLIDEFDPHEPWDPPKNYYELYIDKNYSGNKIIQPIYGKSLDILSEGELKSMRACYAGEVSLCDNWFGYFLNELKEMELYDDSLIILISDHGHSLGEHRAIGKLPTHLYPELIDIPLIIKPPFNFNGARRIQKSYVYVHDLLPTIFGFLEKEIPGIFEGVDLSIFSKEKDQLLENRNYITCSMALWTLYKDDKFAFITANDKSYQRLFNLSKDPKWNEDISHDNPDICKEFYEKIEMDAKGKLLLDFKSTRFDSFDKWYQNTFLM